MALRVSVKNSLPSMSSIIIIPVHINGSAVESLFSRFKYDAGGNLSATNYESAISRLLTADAVSAIHQEESVYRKDKLSLTKNDILFSLNDYINNIHIIVYLLYYN